MATKKIVITSLNAGGGHKTAMYSLGNIIEKYCTDVTVKYFVSETDAIDKQHQIYVNYLPWAYEVVYRVSSWPIFRLIKNIFNYPINMQMEK
jgi:hypothetical protein